MGPIETLIQQKIEAKYNPDLLDIENESNRHSAPLGSESHFKIICVSDNFSGVSRIQRSREIHSLLATEIAQIHAISLKLYTKDEWQNLSNKDLLLSPNCKSKL
ncbi:MAG: BolA/IbaG family iron-sulfur metabolism protein [Bdellovibrionota bacterium]|nr:BolA/IbaG family iron-sulfur metabolism protein [Bdellovibrionota bacterium]